MSSKTLWPSLTCPMLLMLPMLLLGCGLDRDKATWAQGSTLFILYLLAIAVTMLMPTIHQWTWFKEGLVAVKKPILILGDLLQTVGVVAVIAGALAFWSSDWVARLLPFLGCMVLLLGRWLRRWVTESEEDKRATYGKLVVVSSSFMLGMIYLLGC